MNIWQRVFKTLYPDRDANITADIPYSTEQLPTLWLLGKTGAGKSSLVRNLTGHEVEVGNGFSPCTRTSNRYLFPQDQPVMGFLDTRGLAEANYDATADIAACGSSVHALLIVMKAEESEQADVLNALKQIRKSRQIKQALLIHTAVDSLSSNDRRTCVSHNLAQVRKVWGELDSIELDFVTGYNLDALQNKLEELVPIIADALIKKASRTREEANFQECKREIMWYARAAGASNAVPMTGMVTVPAIQTKMLHSLARRYGLEWNRALMAELFGALGAGVGIQYASKLGIQQLVKFIPVYGQTAGAATAAAASYGTTYALGRVACLYFYRKIHRQTINKGEINDLFRQTSINKAWMSRDATSEK